MDIFQLIEANWLTIVATLIAVFVAVYYGTKNKAPRYRLVSVDIVKEFDKKVSSIQILADGKMIPNLSMTKVFFWNTGRESILRADIASKDPLRFEVDKGKEIYEYKVLAETDKSCDFKPILKEKTHLEFQFEFLSKGNGVLVQIFHNALNDAEMRFTGKLTTGQKPNLNTGSRMASFSLFTDPKKAQTIVLLFALLAIIVAIGIGFFFAVALPNALAFDIAFTAIYFAMGLYVLYVYFHDKLPNGLVQYYRWEVEK